MDGKPASAYDADREAARFRVPEEGVAAPALRLFRRGGSEVSR
jgi:hypothetical protein